MSAWDRDKQEMERLVRGHDEYNRVNRILEARVEQLEGALRLVLDQAHREHGPLMTMGVPTAAIDAARAALGEP